VKGVAREHGILRKEAAAANEPTLRGRDSERPRVGACNTLSLIFIGREIDWDGKIHESIVGAVGLTHVLALRLRMRFHKTGHRAHQDLK
jgi:hypothetical protein